jgi:hypothetical protein
MFGGSRRAARLGLLAGCAWSWSLGVSGCLPSDPLGRAGLTLRAPAGWSRVPASTWPVPGRPLAAWSGPSGSSLVVYRTLPAPGAEPDGLALGLVNRLENLPGLRVLGRDPETIGGLPGARVEVVAPGTGDALAPSGMGAPLVKPGQALRPTRRVVVLVPRTPDTLYLVWHAPEENAEALAAQVRATLGALVIDRGTLDVSTY